MIRIKTTSKNKAINKVNKLKTRKILVGDNLVIKVNVLLYLPVNSTKNPYKYEFGGEEF